MKQILTFANLLLGLTAASLVAASVTTWTHPKYPARVNGSTSENTPRKLQPLSLSRKPQNVSVVSALARQNLFRRERTEYVPPVKPPAQVVNIPTLPPPNIILRGVMLLSGKQIAILEGSYPIQENGSGVKNKPLKRKGYHLGERIGDYKITDIERRRVTLNDTRGNVLNIKLARKRPEAGIQRKANQLSHKGSPPPRTRAAPAPRPNPPAPPPDRHISGARSRGSQVPKHISGR